MAEAFKNLFSDELFLLLAKALKQVNCDFREDKFLNQIQIPSWNDLEFKERMHHLADVLRVNLSDEYEDCVNELYAMIAFLKKNGADQLKYAELAFIFIPDLIEKYGLDDFDTSVAAFEIITPFTSCEFAVRPFIIKYEERMFTKVLEWSNHKNEHVRRLASEGSRSRLPWGMAIQSLKKDPSPLFPILENLKNDSSEYVRKSVANNLNDISKDNPEIVMDIIHRWKGSTKETDWVVKHGSRTLLKSGDPEIMQFFGFAAPHDVTIQNFTLQKDVIYIGNDLVFDFDLCNTANTSAKVRLEYGVYYMKKNGSLSKKVYKISEKEYATNSATSIQRRQSFKLISTRKFHVGLHMVSLIINGVEMDEREFELKA